MSRLKPVILTAVIVCIAILAFISASAAIRQPEHGSPVVKVKVGQGHGSAVHIGGGLFLTAHHVVVGETSIELLSPTGTCKDAKVLWLAKEYDLALLEADCSGVGTSPLRCETLSAGDRVISYGNPLDYEFLEKRGYIAGTPHRRGPWALVYPTDMMIAPGMSGGPVTDLEGRLVGINVGIGMMRAGMGSSQVGIALIVPSTVACRMMGR